MTEEEWKPFADKFAAIHVDLKLFMHSVELFFAEHPSLRIGDEKVIHSTKKRLKDPEHLKAKVERKNVEGRCLTPDNFLDGITDLAGVRLIHLFQQDYGVIDSAIRKKIESGDWCLGERAKAFTWDPEVTSFFSSFDLDVEQRETFYTSVHFLIKPRMDSSICCEVQVRTLFEEIWGEVDHKINYPVKSDSLACREQLMVLSKIVGAGSRLVDSIQRSLKSD